MEIHALFQEGLNESDPFLVPVISTQFHHPDSRQGKMQPPPLLPARMQVNHSRNASITSSADGSEWTVSAGSGRGRMEEDEYREKVLRSDHEMDDLEENENDCGASGPPARALPVPTDDDEERAEDW